VLSRISARIPVTAAMLLLVTAAPLWTASAPAAGKAAQQGPDRAEVARAINIIKADPNLATERTIRTLRWVNKSDPAPTETHNSLDWLLQLMGWFAQSARVLVWVAVALLAGLLMIFVLRLIRDHRPATRLGRKAAAPTHVQDLDIRPESLPDNIGSASRALWDSGDHRAALSLLYRGLLSRLVHVHGVPIRDSSTEGDTLRLTATRLAEEKRSYVTQLIRVWQHAVYGGLQPDTRVLYVLCDEFAPALDAA
jgi:Domain of unknown function (DUF4129)